MAALLLIVVAILFVFLYALWKYSYWYRRGVPQGNPLKLLGDLNDIAITRTPYWHHYLELYKKFADKPFFGAYGMGAPRLLIRDSEMLKDVFTKKFSSFSENGFAVSEESEPIIGRDPFFQKGGERWKESRANFSAVMTPSRLRTAMLPEILVVSGELINYLKELKQDSGKGDGTNVKNLSVQYMTNILIRVSLSVDAGSFKSEKSPFVEQAEKLFDNGIQSSVLAILMFIAPQLGSILGISFIPKDVRNFWENVVQQQKRYRNEKGIKRDDVLNFIMKRATDLQSQKDRKHAVDVDLEVLATILMFFLEGFETISTTLAAALVSLAKHEELQENLRTKVLRTCPLGKEITEEAINSITLLQNCITETLRLYPPGMLLQRVVTEDVTLQAKTGESIDLKKGEVLIIPVAGIQRDPEYFPEPEKFDPDRCDDETKKRFFLGFGDGPRQCPGQKFATLAIKVMLAVVLREFKLELSPKTKYPLESVNNPMIFSPNDPFVRFVPL